MLNHTTALLRWTGLLLCLVLFLGACATSRRLQVDGRRGSSAVLVKDNKPEIWNSDHPRVRAFKNHYSKTKTVAVALERGKRYLPAILREFRKRRLPEELAYLPMLESMFENRANSGHAKGLWQFTPQTAREMGLRIGMLVDDRLNWRKATRAAARYLDELGKRFNYNWALALAAYNGGPNYLANAMRSQRSWDFFSLRLRRETAEYVPRFIAMLQVARQKYLNLLLADSR